MRIIRSGPVFALVLLLAAVSPAQDCLDYRDFVLPGAYLSLEGGSSSGLALAGSFAYLVDGQLGLHVVDVADPLAPSLVTTVPVAQARDVEVWNDIAYVVSMTEGLLAFDVTEPITVAPLGAVLDFLGARSLARKDGYLFVARGDSVHVLDTGATGGPARVQVFSVGEEANLKIQENHLFAMGRDRQRFDISDPTAPVPADKALLPPPDPTYRYSTVAARGDYMLSSGFWAGYDGLYYFEEWNISAYDCSSGRPVSLGSISGSAVDLLIHGDLALTSSGRVYDISAGGLPVHLYDLPLEMYGSEIRFMGDWIYVSGSTQVGGGLRTFPVDGIQEYSPQILGQCESYARDFDLAGDLVYTATYHGLEVLDVSDPTDPGLITTVEPDVHFDKIGVDGDRGALLWGTTFYAVDLGLPENPVVAEPIDLAPVSAEDMTVAGGLAVVVGSVSPMNNTGRLLLVDVSDPAATAVVGQLDLPAVAMVVAVRDSLAYVVSQGDDRLRVVDFAVVDAPVVVAEVVLPEAGFYPSLALHGDLLLVGNRYRLAAYSLADPRAPVPAGELEFDHWVWGVAAAGSFAYPKLYNDDSLHVVDLSEAGTLWPVAPLRTEARSEDVRSDGRLVFTHDGRSLRIFPPQCESTAVPVLLQRFMAAPTAATVELVWDVSGVPGGTDFRLLARAAGQAREVSYTSLDGVRFRAIDDSPLLRPGLELTYSLYLTGAEDRLLREVSVRVPGVAAVTGIRSLAPNPFNPETVIAFDLEKRGEVRLEVYDVRGGLVRRLIDGATMTAGRHEEAWNGLGDGGNPVPSGIYVVRLRAGGAESYGKATLLK